MFIGTNNQFDPGISTFTDRTEGVLDSGNTHFNFGVVKFDDLTGIATVANGGPSKYLTLDAADPGTALIGISAAADDVLTGYPSPFFGYSGPTPTTDVNRLQWYFDNVKGDDDEFGGYAGGATHAGTISVDGVGDYSVDVTSIVDSWIDGTTPNHGFGLWAVSTTAGQSTPLDFASSQHPTLDGPRLTSVPAGPGNITTIPIVEDVMTSGFFIGDNRVRGYDPDNRNEHRVSTTGAFGVSGAETIYVTFDPAQFSNQTGPVDRAVLRMESVDGGFDANASVDAPFTVSAHAVNADPITSITDDTNPEGPISWTTFFNSNILDADPAAQTAIDGFGTVEFDVTSIVNDWISGSNEVFALALTGKNDVSGVDFLHGFLNNSENPGATVLNLFGGSSGLTGDFDMSGELDFADINLLTQTVLDGTDDAAFDLNGDGAVNDEDRRVWVEDLKGTFFGDANLDLVVDVSDFNIWNSNKFTTDSQWQDGDFSGDQNVDVSDFGIWNANKFQSANDTAAVPEPTGCFALLWGIGLIGIRCRRFSLR
ncbi:MAG: hypothetical protein AAF497_10700 [Planctomycetota bacterium]